MTDQYILLIEDNQDELLLTERAFSRCAPIAITIARNGQEALNFFFESAMLQRSVTHAGQIFSEQEKPLFILLDLNLPKIGGLEVLRQVHSDARTSTIPVIILTSSLDDRDVSESYKLGAREYLHKPTSFSDFVLVIRGLMDRWLPVGVGEDCP